MKGLLITLVVIGHLPYFEYDSRTLILIYSFHMHAFLIIGGMLSHINEDTKLSTILYKRIKGTLIPYFVFYLITFIIVPTTTEQKLNAIPVVIKGIGIPPDHALNLPLWFLTFYFVAMTVFEIIQFISHKIAGTIANAVGANANTVGAKHSEPDSVGAKHREPDSVGADIIRPRRDELCEPALQFLLTLIFVSIIMRISFVYARIYKLPRLPYNIEIAGYCLGFVFLGNILGKIVPKIYKCWQHIGTNNDTTETDNIHTRMGELCEPSQTKNANSNSTRTFKNKSVIIKIVIVIITIFALILIAKTWYEYSMWNGRIDLNARDYKNAFYMYVDAILGFTIFAVFSYIIFIVSIFAEKRLDILNNDVFDDSLLKGIPSLFYILLNLPTRVFSYLGENSLYILAFHVPSVFYTNAFVTPFLPMSIREILSHNSMISIFILTALGISFSLMCSLILKTFLKKLFK